MRLILVRHAQSANNLLVTQVPRAEWERTRSADPELTALGLDQAEVLGPALATHLDELASDGIVIRTSPMLRTLQTARPLLAARGDRSVLWRDIHEVGGLFVGVVADGTAVGRPGITRAELAASFPEFTADDAHGADGWWGRGVEDDDEFHTRVGLVAEVLLARALEVSDASTVVLISHGTFLGALLRRLVPPEESADLCHHHNAAYSELTLGGDAVTLVRHDVTDHLSEDLLTV